MEERDTDQDLNSSEGREFRRFWLPVVLVIGGGFLVAAIGGFMGSQQEEAARNVPLDEVHTYSQCEVLGKQDVGYRRLSRYVNTSCGVFSVSKELFSPLKQGGVYDFTTVKTHGLNKPYISEVKVSTEQKQSLLLVVSRRDCFCSVD